jgi:hypothetical protein
MSPFSRLIRHHPVSAQANQQTSFASGLRPHPWRGGNANGGFLERGGGSARSVSMCGTRGVNFTMQKVPFLETHSTSPRLRTGESTDLVRFWPSPTSMARRKRQRRASSGARWWVGTVRFYVRNKRGELHYMQNICPLSRLIRYHPVSAQANQQTSFASGLRPHPW